MNYKNTFQDIIDEIKWEMKEERSYANIFLSNINDNANDYVLENSKRLMREKIQYIAGLANALRFLGFMVTFDIATDSKHENVHYYNDVHILREAALCPTRSPARSTRRRAGRATPSP